MDFLYRKLQFVKVISKSTSYLEGFERAFQLIKWTPEKIESRDHSDQSPIFQNDSNIKMRLIQIFTHFEKHRGTLNSGVF